MARRNNNENLKPSFITSSFIVLLGILFILLSILLDFNVVPIQTKEFTKVLITIFSKGLSAIGVSLIVGFITRQIHKADEHEKEQQQLKQLERIIISKEFLHTLSIDSKRETISTLLMPDNSSLLNHPNIKEYLNMKSEKHLKIFDNNFRTNFIINVKVYYKEEVKRFYAKYTMSYRIYKINDEFAPVETAFEKDTQIISTKIKYNNDLLLEVKNNDYNKKNEIYSYTIPKEYQIYDYLCIERTIEEAGHSHWISINWKSFTPIEGINFRIECTNGIIKEYYIFDKDSLYSTPEIDEERKSLNINSSMWLDPFTGICVIISNTELEEDIHTDGAPPIVS